MAGTGDPGSAAPGRTRVTVDASDPAFDGHFPADPVLPGVTLLVLVLSAVRERLGPRAWVAGIPSLRWRQPVRPGDELSIAVEEPTAGDHVGFEVRRGSALVANGSLVVRDAAA